MTRPMKRFCRDCEQFKDGMGKFTKYCTDCRQKRFLAGLEKKRQYYKELKKGKPLYTSIN